MTDDQTRETFTSRNAKTAARMRVAADDIAALGVEIDRLADLGAKRETEVLRLRAALNFAEGEKSCGTCAHGPFCGQCSFFALNECNANNALAKWQPKPTPAPEPASEECETCVHIGLAGMGVANPNWCPVRRWVNYGGAVPCRYREEEAAPEPAPEDSGDPPCRRCKHRGTHHAEEPCIECLRDCSEDHEACRERSFPKFERAPEPAPEKSPRERCGEWLPTGVADDDSGCCRSLAFGPCVGRAGDLFLCPKAAELGLVGEECEGGDGPQKQCTSCRYCEYPCSHPDKGDEAAAQRLAPNCLGLKGVPFLYRLWEAKEEPAPEVECELADGECPHFQNGTDCVLTSDPFRRVCHYVSESDGRPACAYRALAAGNAQAERELGGLKGVRDHALNSKRFVTTAIDPVTMREMILHNRKAADEQRQRAEAAEAALAEANALVAKWEETFPEDEWEKVRVLAYVPCTEDQGKDTVIGVLRIDYFGHMADSLAAGPPERPGSESADTPEPEGRDL